MTTDGGIHTTRNLVEKGKKGSVGGEEKRTWAIGITEENREELWKYREF
jgi:hypothetical protein